MKKLVLAAVIVALFCGAFAGGVWFARHDGVVGSQGSMPTPSRQEFIRQAVEFQYTCRLGARFDKVSEELAKVKTAFRMAEGDYRKDNPTQFDAFKTAISRWDAACDFWVLQNRGETTIWGSDVAKALAKVGAPAPEPGEPFPAGLRAKHGNGMPADGISTEKLVQFALQKGSAEFQAAMDSGPYNSSVAKVKP